jgi:hypothetical protein
MATTTNYSWATPDDTALVKDGASAIRSLGTSIDTTTKNLNPSTTLGDIEYRSSTANTNTRLGIGSSGQVLTVAAGVPSWANPSDQTPLTTKGDLFTFSTLDARLGVGTDGQVLTAASGATTGLEWQTASGMTLISTTTLTGASVTLSSIPQTYKDLKIIVRNFKPANDGEVLDMRMNSDSTANRHRDGLAGGGVNTFNATRFYLGAAQDNSVATGLTEIDIPDYTNTATWKWMQASVFNVDSTTTTSVSFNPTWGVYNQTAAITSLDFFPNGGNFTSGTILLYGVK